jgi:regulator of sirC expression with transglutaminase-like and TPR domain
MTYFALVASTWSHVMSRHQILAVVVVAVGAEIAWAQDGPAESARQIQVLIQNLDSQDFAVREAATKKLVDLGERAMPAVEAVRKHSSAEVRYRAEFVLQRLKIAPLLKLRKELADFVHKSGELDVEQGMFLLSRILDGKVKKEDLTRQLDEIASKVRDRLGKDIDPAKAEPAKAVAALRQVMFTDLGYGPNEEDYYNVDNCSLARILETKKGRPVFVCHVMIAVARRLEIPIVGVPVSGKYIVKYDGSRAPAGFSKNDIYIHVYDKGRILSRDDRAREYPSHDPDGMVPPDSSRDVLDRMLNNLAATLGSRNQPGDTQRRELIDEFSEFLTQSNPAKFPGK